jgi:hypothetical protein
MGNNMMNNFAAWGEKRKGELRSSAPCTPNEEECKKLDVRITKFQEKMSFVKEFQRKCTAAENENRSSKSSKQK